MPRHPLRNDRLCLVVGFAVVALGPRPLRAEEPLHQRIDRAIAAKPDFAERAAPLADDAEFLRRVHLDLVGTIPTSAEARAFLQDASPGKRGRLIDRLLASPEHARHLATVFDVLLTDRRPDKHVPRAAWLDYLRASFADNKPWDVFVREVLSADGAGPKQRPAAKFYLDRDGEPHQITKDVSRLFLGRNYQCAQCHDHPIVDDYKQADYYGIYAFFNRSSLFTDKNRLVTLAEKADGEATYQSVFDAAKVTKSALPRVPGGEAATEAPPEKGKEYEVAPAAGVRHVPKFSRRARLAGQVTAPENVAFRRAAVNRLWALMTGRGLVHPVDLDHAANPPSHPELLDRLAEEFAASKYDVRAFLREVALSQTYQRSSAAPEGAKEGQPESFAVARLKPLSPEQLALALMQATGQTDVQRKALGKNATEAALSARLAPNVTPFVTTFGNRPGQPAEKAFEATLDQTLFLANGKLIQSWLAPASGNLVGRLATIKDEAEVVEELYLSVLTRRPDDDERKVVVEYLRGRAGDRAAALQELAWALLASAEFRFNH